MRILILGPSGQIGYELALQAAGIAEVVTAGRSAADIILDPLDTASLQQLFIDVKPDIVINAIAYTAVDKAETEQQQAFRLNADLPAALADECEKINCLLLHYSTDFVFDGTETTAWRELAETNPLSVYGRSKLAGEKAVQISGCTSLILRTSWVYGDRGSNFLLTMLRLARERETLSVVNDQMGSPSCSYDIAKATIAICQAYGNDADFVKKHQGLYHLSAAGETSWYGFATAIFELAREFETLKIKELLPISSDDYATAATRPSYSVLDCQRVKDNFSIALPQWQQSLKDCIRRYYQ